MPLIRFGHGTYELSIRKLANESKDVFSLCHEALALVSFEAHFAEVPDKQQFARFSWLLGVWAERIAGFGIREGCHAVTVPGTNFTAHPSCFVPNLFSSGGDSPFHVKSVRLCRRCASSQAG